MVSRKSPHGRTHEYGARGDGRTRGWADGWTDGWTHKYGANSSPASILQGPSLKAFPSFPTCRQHAKHDTTKTRTTDSWTDDGWMAGWPDTHHALVANLGAAWVVAIHPSSQTCCFLEKHRHVRGLDTSGGVVDVQDRRAGRRAGRRACGQADVQATCGRTCGRTCGQACGQTCGQTAGRRRADVRADARADVRAEGEGTEQEGRTDGVLLEHGDDLSHACRILAELADDVLLEETRQLGAAAQGRFARWHQRRRRRRRSGPTCG